MQEIVVLSRVVTTSDQYWWGLGHVGGDMRENGGGKVGVAEEIRAEALARLDNELLEAYHRFLK